ncbi:hypothetical protein X953_12995 [Virgibacillus sp. SK37]|nr:hypothetical protein X953_12995 [Virgibacillus sp. SK37]CDQ36056.1 hypothetical protein BN993_05548 [Virgibacillus halodenitrificans]
MKNKTLCNFLLLLTALVGYRMLTDYMEDTKDFR